MAKDRRVNDPFAPGVVLRSLSRAFDDLPIYAQLYITHRCNLDCAYCSEYDNTKDHVPYDTLVARIDKVRALGCLHADMIGGEPLLHPRLADLMRHVTARGMSTGMTTNAFLLTDERLRELIDAGMGRIQISVDAVEPSAATPKSLKTLRKKIAMVARYPIWFRVNTVICEETLDQVEEVARACWDLGVAVNFAVVHDRGRLDPAAASPRILERLRWLRREKQRGMPVATPYYLVDYYEQALQGTPVDWTCQGGNKCFYVSGEGKFQFCYHVRSNRDVMDVTRTEMAAYRGKKGCETNCGVDCNLHTSLPFSNRGQVLKAEIRHRAGQFLLPVLR